MSTSLSVLDLIPVSSGSSPREAIENSIDLARHVEALGYQRYWFAEHHLNPGVVGTSPTLAMGAAAAATSRISFGSGALLMGHRSALAAVEEIGFLNTLYPGRIELGLGRSGGSAVGSGSRPSQRVIDGRTENGLLVPAPFSSGSLLSSPRLAAQRSFFAGPQATQPYVEVIDDILGFVSGTWKSPDGVELRAVTAESASLRTWVFGSSGGESAEVAGARGLRFGANYHVAPAGVIDAVDAYRAAFRPSADLAQPYVVVSVDVVVAETTGQAKELASGYPLWVRSIRSGEGAIEFPTPDQARQWEWSESDQALVHDRVITQFVGSATEVANQLECLQEATGADELALTTITHGHSDRRRSYELIAQEWAARGN